MSAKLGFFSCRNFHAEIAAAIAIEAWDDVICLDFPARCGRPLLSWEELRLLLPEDCDQLTIIGRVCLSRLGEPPADFPTTRFVRLEQCFHLVAGQELVNEAITGGGYLITASWLANWRERLQEIGFTLEQAGEFFQDFAKELVFLDTGLDLKAQSYLAELRDTVKLPIRHIAVGLDYTRLRLTQLVLEWRLEKSQQTNKQQLRHHSSELANYVCAMDILANLAQTQRETGVISAIKDLFQMLFAPQAVYYLRVENDISFTVDSISAELQQAMQALKEKYAWTVDEQGFLLRIKRGDSVQALIAVDKLAFPEYRERYLNMALALIDVCALAIENARNQKKLLEAEKMASLAILVAGVAHEINTPLGVSLTATTALQDQSRYLIRAFAERSMTQSNLNQYLNFAKTSTELLHANLQRIGHLIEIFHQIAVNDKSLEKQLFCLKNCLDEVICSLADRLGEQITLDIQCDPNLEINSLVDDWTSIFINLISNSIRYAFKDRQQGSIKIQINSDTKKLWVDYYDDGIGLTAEVLARIFDPFFTTDLQQGMGLGMHLVYNLITQRLNGTIQCNSQLNQGVHFHIEIPK